MNKVEEKILEKNLTKYILQVENGYRINLNLLKRDARDLNIELLEFLFDEFKDEYFKMPKEGVWVFEREKFLDFISYKNFLSDSYTRFANKIALCDTEGNSIAQNTDVVLDFPFKDCVLEGGASKDSDKKKEIFFNQTLANEEIDRLFSPKVLHNFSYITQENTDLSVQSDISKIPAFIQSDDLSVSPPPLGFPNLLLKGNNLQALYTLKSIPSIYGNVKLIYIDPPYNTGNDSFNYNDNFNHSSWLTFMKNRLEIAREFLRDDGVIFIQCDDNEQAYLKVLCDEIFGRENFVNSVAVKTSETSGVKMAHIETKLPKIKEFLLLYKKNNLQIKPIKISKIDNDSFNKYSKYYSNIIENFNDEVKNWKITPLNEYLINNNLNLDEKQVVDFKIKNAHRMIYRTNNKSFEKYQIETNLAEITSSTGLKYVWWEGKQMLFLSDYLTETLGDLWIDISTINLNKEGECDFTNAKKPEALIQRIIEISTQKGDLVMDFFAGSGTTLAVAHKMGRRWVGIEQMDYIESITKERLCKVVLGEQGGVSKAVSWNPMQKNLLEEDSLPNSFVYAELMPLNETYKKLILEATEANISEVIEKMRENAFLDYRVDFVKIAKDSDFNALSLEDKKRILFSCLDSNLSYIPFSEIEDSDFKIPESLLQANKAFYRINKGIK